MISYGPIIRNALTQLSTTLPVMIAWLVGIIIAIVRWKKNPKTSLLTLIGLVILMGVHIILSVFNTSFYYLASINGMKGTTVRVIQIVVQIVLSLVASGGWVLLLVALFGKPKKKAEETKAEA